MAKRTAVFEKLVDEVELAKKNAMASNPFTIGLSNWINGFSSYEAEIFEKRTSNGGTAKFLVRRGIKLNIKSKDGRSILISKFGYGEAVTKKEAYEFCFQQIYEKILSMEDSVVQMDVVGDDKDLFLVETITSHKVDEKASNVILEVAHEADSEVAEEGVSLQNKKLASSETPYDMIGQGHSLMNRWTLLESFSIDTSTEDIFGMRLPESLYKDNENLITLLPLRGFLYGDLDLEIKIVINAAPFHAGRLLFGLFYCSQGMDKFITLPDKVSIHEDNLDGGEITYRNIKSEIMGVNGMLQRPHVICDLAHSTSSEIEIKFMYNKSYIRLMDFSNNKNVNPGIIGSNFVYLSGRVISKLQTGDSQSKAINGTVFFKFTKVKLTGMAKTHTFTQMDEMEKSSRQLLRKGRIVRNTGKPSMVFNNIVTIPRPRLHFPNGKGLGDTVVMSIDPRTLTTHYDKVSGPQSYLELARIPGISQKFTWHMNSVKGNSLFSEKVEPFINYSNAVPISDEKIQGMTVDSLPLHVATNGFMNWGGTIIYEFDVVKTDFHKGTILISITYGVGSTSDHNSTYEKIVDIQENTKIKVTVPYIYDTICRRCPNTPYFRSLGEIGAWNNLSVPFSSQTRINVVVVNPLINIESVGKSVDILVWKYAGEDFFLNSICQVNNLAFHCVMDTSNFPNHEDVTIDKVDAATDYVNFNWCVKPKEVRQVRDVREKLKFQQKGVGYIDENNVAWDKDRKNYFYNKKWHFFTGDYPYEVQMDFCSGIKNDNRIKTGDETNFKNILRMPIRILSNYKITESDTFYLPVCPITSTLIDRLGLNYSVLSMTHHYQIMRMFRLWRGSLRYTIVVRGQNPVWVTFLPASGCVRFGLIPKMDNVRLMCADHDGNMPLFFSKDGKGVPDMSSSGNYLTMILEKINPSEVVEIPWSLPENWAFTSQSTLTNNLGFREIGGLVNGHLCIYSDKPCEIDVLISIGDDFEMNSFCGITDNVSFMQKTTRRDDCRFRSEKIPAPSFTQGDFSDFVVPSNVDSNIVDKVKNFAVEHLDTTSLLLMGGVLLPPPISDICRFYSIRRLERKMSTAINGVKNVANSVNDVCTEIRDEGIVAKIGDTIGNINDDVVKPLGDVIKPIRSGVVGATTLLTQGSGYVETVIDYIKGLFNIEFDFWSVGNNVYKVITELLYFLLNNSFGQFITSFLNIIKGMGLLSTEWVDTNLQKIVDLFKKVMCSQTQSDLNNSDLIEQGEIALLEEDKKTLIGLLFGGILTTVGVYTQGWWQKGYKWFLHDYVYLFTVGKGLSTMNGSISFVRNCFSCVKNLVTGILGYENDEVRIRHMLSGKNNLLDNFINNAQEFLNNINDSSMGNIKNKSKYWITVCNAYQLQGCIMRLGHSSVGNVLINLCRDVIRKANENCSLFQATAVRYEPFVICIEGESGIGKSFLSSELAVIILDNLQIKTDTIDIKYTVNPGVNYWNLYNGQPIIVYDDWANFTDEGSSVKEFSELFQLKTSNVMNAPKAELSEKKTVVNPFGVILCTNNPYPSCNALFKKTALLRRRDVVVSCRVRPNQQELNYENYDHLQFQFHKDPTKSSPIGDWLDYNDFEIAVREMHMRYHIRESNNVKKRISILNKCLKQEALVSDNLQDPFTLQARSLHMMEKEDISSQCPSEYLEAQVVQLISLIEKNFSKVNLTGDKIVVKGLGSPVKHMYVTKQTQGWLDSGYDYFIVPIVDTYKSLCKYVDDWMYFGLRCGNCSSFCSDGWVVKRCEGCSRNFCSRCAKITEDSVKCPECEDNLTLVGIPWFDYIISFIVSCTWETFGMSKINVLTSTLLKWLTGYEMLLPLTVIRFLIKYVLTYISNKNEISKNDIQAIEYENLIEENVSETQGVEDALDAIQVVTKCNVHPIPKTITSTGAIPKNYRKGKQKREELNKINEEYEPEPDRTRISLAESVIGGKETFNDDEKQKAADERKSLYMCRIALFEEEKNVGICRHYQLLSNPSALYYNYNWTHKLERWSSKPCKGNVDCPIRTLGDEHYLFIERHLEENESIYRGFIKDLENKKILRADFEQKVPQYYWPDWVFTIPAKEEAAKLTSLAWWESLGEYIPNWIKNVCKIVAGVGFIYGVVRCCKGFVSMVKDFLFRLFGWEGETQINFEYDENGQKRPVKKNRRVRRGLSQTNGGIDICEDKSQLYYHNILDKVVKNFVKIKLNNYKEIIGIGLYGSKLLIPKHYRAPIEKAEVVEIRFANTHHETIVVNKENINMIDFANQDATIMEFSKAISFKDIRKFFILEKDMEDFTEDEIIMLIPRETGTIEEIDLEVSGFAEEHEAFDKFSNTFFYSKGVIEYNFQEKGVCGSLLVRKSGHRPIIGIHVAGVEISNCGVGILVHKESIAMDNSYDFAPLPYKLSDEVLDFGEGVNVEYLGKIDVKLTPHMPTKSDIVHSAIDELFEEPNEVQPAILTRKDERYIHSASPLVCGVRKHGKPTFDFPQDLVDDVARFWESQFMKFPFEFQHKAKIYDMREATLGKPEVVDYYDYLPDNTSAGWPWNVIEKVVDGHKVLASKKKNWIYYQRNEQLQPIDVEFDPLLVDVYEKEMAYRRAGLLAPIVFQDVLKDEKRKIEKLMKEGGTRVFSMSPITASIALRAYTLDFTSWIRFHRIKNWIAVGISCDGPEWSRLVNRLRTKGDNIFSIDFSNFGPGLNVPVAEKFSSILNKFNREHMEVYTEEDEKVAEVMIKELTHSVHLAGGTLYRTKAGSPSGAAITVEINSYVHLMYLVIVWSLIARIVKELSKKDKGDSCFLGKYDLFISEFKRCGLNANNFVYKMTYDHFIENVVGCVYGDDGIFSVSDDYKEIFNAKTIQLILAVHGIVATDATKQENVVRYDTIEKMTFLKRGFAPHPKFKMFWLAPIEDTSIKECARWIHKARNSKEMTRINVQASLLLAYGKGVDWYDKWQKKLNTYLIEAKIHAVYLKWEEIDEFFFPDLYGFTNEKNNLELKEVYKNIPFI